MLAPIIKTVTLPTNPDRAFELFTQRMQVQEKLLRVVEYGEFQRLGGEKVLSTNVRVVAATNVDLPSKAAKGDFRADLLDRLAFDVVTLPPLRARTADISLLADFFARRMAREMAEDFPGFAPSAIAAMVFARWALDKVLPMDTPDGFRYGGDGYFTASVPLYGPNASHEPASGRQCDCHSQRPVGQPASVLRRVQRF